MYNFWKPCALIEKYAKLKSLECEAMHVEKSFKELFGKQQSENLWLSIALAK